MPVGNGTEEEFLRLCFSVKNIIRIDARKSHPNGPSSRIDASDSTRDIGRRDMAFDRYLETNNNRGIRLTDFHNAFNGRKTTNVNACRIGAIRNFRCRSPMKALSKVRLFTSRLKQIDVNVISEFVTIYDVNRNDADRRSSSLLYGN